MGYVILTGNEEFAKAAKRNGGYDIPVEVSSVVDDTCWAIYLDDTRVAGPRPLTLTTRTDARNALRELRSADEVVPPDKRGIPKVEPPASLALTLDQVTKEILGLQKRTVRNYIEIGRWLHEAKKLAGHGHWLEYLEHNVFLSEYQAQSCMKMFTDWGANPHLIEDLNFSKVNLIGQAKPEARPILIELAKTAPTATVEQAVREANKSPSPHLPPEPPQEPAPPNLPPTPTSSPAKATAAREVKPKEEPVNTEAAKFNAGVAQLLEAATKTLLTFKDANGSAETGGDGFGLNSVYALQDALSAVQGHLVRVISECARRPGE